MFKNYFITALRHILRNKLYSMINIVGLAIGLAACLLIFLFVRYETSYDNWMPGAENIYRVNYFSSIGDRTIACGCIPGITKAAMDERFSEIEESVRFYPLSPVITHKDRAFKEDVWMADPNFLRVFQLPFVEGNRSTAFDELSSIVISKRMAVKYFGDQSPIGEVFTFDHQDETRSYKITGVFEDVPDNSEFNFEIIFPLDNTLYADSRPVNTNWYNTWGYLYLKLQEGSDPALINQQLPDLVEKNVPPKADPNRPDRTVELAVQNLKDIHLRSHGHAFGPIRGIKPNGDINQVYTFSFVAFLILVIACVNFVNLSTARSLRRAKEVGIRKVVGANRSQLIRQFLGENILIATFGLLLAFVLVDVLTPSFNTMLDLSLGLEQVPAATLILTGFALLLFVGVVSGVYPAFYLSSFRPAKTLINDNHSKASSLLSFRNSLTVFQFSVSITLIIATSIIYFQNLYGVNKDLGFSKENKLVVRQMFRPSAVKNHEAIVSSIRQLPDVEAVSMSTVVPTDRIGWTQNMSVQDQSEAGEKALASTSVDPNYFAVYDIPILVGRALDITREKDILVDESLSDSEFMPIRSALLNEAALGLFGFRSAEEALGQILLQQRGNIGIRRMEIIGVVRDYHYNSLREPIRPLVYYHWPDFMWSMTVKYREGTDTAKLQSDLSNIWDEFVPDFGVTIEFIDDRVAGQYTAEIKQSKMLLAFSILAIVVACLGLYGLAAFTAEQRTKEIAIRKVHGAEVWDVMKLLLMQFSKPVLISNLIAWPVAWYLMTDYLNGFIFRIDLSPTYFIATGLLALIIAWATTGYNALKVARTSPAVVLSND